MLPAHLDAILRCFSKPSFHLSKTKKRGLGSAGHEQAAERRPGEAGRRLGVGLIRRQMRARRPASAWLSRRHQGLVPDFVCGPVTSGLVARTALGQQRCSTAHVLHNFFLNHTFWPRGRPVRTTLPPRKSSLRRFRFERWPPGTARCVITDRLARGEQLAVAVLGGCCDATIRPAAVCRASVWLLLCGRAWTISHRIGRFVDWCFIRPRRRSHLRHRAAPPFRTAAPLASR